MWVGKKQALTWLNKFKGEFLCFIKFKIEIVIISLNLFSFNNSFFSFWWINLKSNKQVNVVFAILNLKLFPFLLYIFLLQQFRIFPFQVEPSIFTSVDVTWTGWVRKRFEEFCCSTFNLTVQPLGRKTSLLENIRSGYWHRFNVDYHRRKQLFQVHLFTRFFVWICIYNTKEYHHNERRN